jgi:DNA polymerase elongation subunit (family B)
MSLKRRDYAPILKVVLRKAIDEIMDRNDVAAAAEYCKRGAMDLIEKKVKTVLLILSNSLRSDYANPQSIAHKVLADRMAARDPGSAPGVGDRVDYIYIKNPKANLKGDRIENPAYIKEHGLEIDSAYYIQNQLWNPIGQVFGPLLERIPGFCESMLPSNFDELSQEKQIDVRSETAAKLLFGPALAVLEKGEKQKALNKMFGPAVTLQTTTRTPRNVVASVIASGDGTITVNAAKKSPKQSRMTNYFINKQILETVGSSKRKTRSRESSISTGSTSSKGSVLSRK